MAKRKRPVLRSSAAAKGGSRKWSILLCWGKDYNIMQSRGEVFISYSQDDVKHVQRVLHLSNKLRSEGIDCVLDQYESSPKEGWPRWMDKKIREALPVAIGAFSHFLHLYWILGIILVVVLTPIGYLLLNIIPKDELTEIVQSLGLEVVFRRIRVLNKLLLKKK